MKLGTQVGLGPGHVVLDGDPAPLPKKGTEPPHVYCGHGRASQLLLSSCIIRHETIAAFIPYSCVPYVSTVSNSCLRTTCTPCLKKRPTFDLL